MAYQALARKWRPRKFSEIVGQEHVVRALTHALAHDRMHHAYLFTGTRGVGKTTVARILAKALNCSQREGPEPCGQCLPCRELDEGRFVDLIEVDAASRTKVEDTRDLLENVQYAPSHGRYKVYLIDEVHMLSGHSFNALLKTLEEPPAHVKFLLATTDPQKIPVTVLSRCLQFNLKRLAPEQIGSQIEAVLGAEGVAFDAAAVKALARAADGSMRDGLSLLDQAIVHGGGAVRDTEVSAMLGTVARQPVFALLGAIAAGDGAALVGLIDAMARHAPNFGDVLQQLLAILHHAALAQWVPEALARDDDAEAIAALAAALSPEDLQLFYQTALIGRRDLPLAPEPRMGFEMVLLRMLAFRPGQTTTVVSPMPVPRVQAPSRAEPVAPAPTVRPDSVDTPPSIAPPAQVHSADTPVAGAGDEDWSTIIEKAGLVAVTRQLAQHCVLDEITDGHCKLHLDPNQEHLRTPRSQANLEAGLTRYFGRPIKLTIVTQAPSVDTPAVSQQKLKDERQRAAELEIEQDENVRALRERFEARIVPGSIKPIE